MTRALQGGFLLAAAAGVVLAAGCGEEDEPIPLPSGPISIAVRNGTWMVNEAASFTGADSCLARPDTTFAGRDTLCTVDLGESPFPFPTNCTMSASGDTITFDCTIAAPLGICRQLIELSGTGTVNDTTYDLSGTLTTRLEPNPGVDMSDCIRFYGNRIDACTTLVTLQGAFVDTGGSYLCPASASAPLVLESLVFRAGAFHVLEE